MIKNLNIIGALLVIYIIFSSATSISKTNSNEVFDNEILTTSLQVKLEKLIENKCLEKDAHYYSYDELTELLDELQQDYSNIFMYESLGKTHEGRNVWLVKISDNVEINESEPEVLFTGGIHGNELPAYQVLIYSIKAIVENYTVSTVNESLTNRIRNAVNNSEMFFVPMYNPDGCEAIKRKNSRNNSCIFGKTLFRGVDLNRNYDYNWDDVYKHPLRYIRIPRSFKALIEIIISPTNWLFERGAILNPVTDFRSIFGGGMYRGPYAFSEPETRGVKNFVENHSVVIWIDYHTYGEEIFYPAKPWHYKDQSDLSIFKSISENMSSINGYKTPTHKIPPSLNTSGGGIAWGYWSHDIYAFIIELCDSLKVNYNPDIEKMLEVYNNHLSVNLYVAERAMTMF